MHKVDVNGLISAAQSLLHAGEQRVDRHQGALDDRGQEHESHGDADDGVQYAEDLSLARERRLVAVADGGDDGAGEEKGLAEAPRRDARAVFKDGHSAVVGLHHVEHERLEVGVLHIVLVEEGLLAEYQLLRFGRLDRTLDGGEHRRPEGQVEEEEHTFSDTIWMYESSALLRSPIVFTYPDPGASN